jgi:hypothetical protein
MLVGDGERSLGELGVSQPNVVGNGDNPFAVLLHERSQERSTLVPVRLDDRLDETGPQLGQAVIAQVEAPL